MRYDDVTEAQDGIDESTSGFIDIQFGLIAILILALSVTTRGLIDGSEQLARSQSGSNVFIEMFLSDEDAETSRLSCAKREKIHKAVRFGNLALCAEWDDGVAVLGPWGDNGALFESGQSKLPIGQSGERLVAHLQGRTRDLLLCIAPLDRNMVFEAEEALKEFKFLISRCQKTHYAVAARALDPSWSAETGVAGLRLPGLDLFMIEGHADGQPPFEAKGQGGRRPLEDDLKRQNDSAAVAGARAQRVLYAMLNPHGAENIGSFLLAVNDIENPSLPFEIDKLASELPGQPGRDSNYYQSGLLDLVPLSRRVYQECYIYAQPSPANQDDDATPAPATARTRIPIWCAALLGMQYSEQIDAEGFVQIERSTPSGPEAGSSPLSGDLYIPRLFALSNFDRFSLRHGELGRPNNRDRRVEFRFLTAAIPAEIHQLVRARKNTDYYLLYTAAATMELHNCDMERAPDGTCVDRLNRLVLGELTGLPET